MSIFKRGTKFSVYVPKRNGGRAIKTTSTSDKATAKGMDAMLQRLAGQRKWDFIDGIHEGKLTVARLYDADASNGLSELQMHLSDVDLQSFVHPWLDGVRTRTSLTSDTVQQYETKLRSLMPVGKPFLKSQLSYPRLTKWLAALPVGPSTKRKYHAALSSFCQHLLYSEVIETNPMRMVKAPRANPPRDRYLSLTEAMSLVEAHDEPYKAVCALLHCGMEIGAVLKLKRSDVDRANKEVRARGTKTHTRDRIIYVMEWAWPYVERHIATMLPDALLFPNVDRWAAGKAHVAACKARGIENYTQHDGRHTFAVIALRAGATFEVIARQLGHANIAQVVRCYTRHKPQNDDYRSWERKAFEQEARRIQAG